MASGEIPTQDLAGLGEAAAAEGARAAASRLRSAEGDRVAVDEVLSLLAADKSGCLAAVSEAMQAVARRWRELVDNLPAGDQDRIVLQQGAHDLEQARHADSQWRRQLVIEALGARQIWLGTKIEQSAVEITERADAVDQLRFAQRAIRDLGASLAAAPLFVRGSYADMRGRMAADALRNADLQRLLTISSARPDSTRNLEAIIQSLIRRLDEDEREDIAEVFGLLGILEDSIAEILKRRPNRSDADAWLKNAKNILNIVGHFIMAVGIVFAVAAGSLLSIGRHPAAADEVQAIAALVIGAACGILQRDMPALWRQPSLSRHLAAANKRLHEEIAELLGALHVCAEMNIDSAGPSFSMKDIIAHAHAVQCATYSAACLAAAAYDWTQRPRYLEVMKRINRSCEEAENSEDRINARPQEVFGELQPVISHFGFPPELQLRPEAKLTLIGRILDNAGPPGKLQPAIRPGSPAEALEKALSSGRAGASSAGIVTDRSARATDPLAPL